MKINKDGIAEASILELLAFYIYDNDLFKLMSFEEWIIRCKAQGVKVSGGLYKQKRIACRG